MTPDDSGYFTDEGHDLCGMVEVREYLHSTNDELFNRLSQGKRAKANTMCTNFFHLRRSFIFIDWLQLLTDSLPFLETVDDRNTNPPRDGQSVNEASLRLHEKQGVVDGHRVLESAHTIEILGLPHVQPGIGNGNFVFHDGGAKDVPHCHRFSAQTA